MRLILFVVIIFPGALTIQLMEPFQSWQNEIKKHIFMKHGRIVLAVYIPNMDSNLLSFESICQGIENRM